MGFKTAPSSLKRGLAQLIQQRGIVVFVISFAIIGGSILLLATHAASPYASVNTNQGTLTGGALAIADATSSTGNAVQFSSGSSSGGTKCGLTNVAFCDTFDAPAGNGNRSGDLNGVVWGVSRQLGTFNFGQQQYDMGPPTQLQACNGTPTVSPPKDIIICNGQLREATNDNPTNTFDAGTVSSLAMYPKQPFDFAGATAANPGIVTFDVSNDTHGIHAAWPEFWISDKPVPDPFSHFDSWTSESQDGFGIRFAGGGSAGQFGTCPTVTNSDRWTVDSAEVVRNYVQDDFHQDSNTHYGTPSNMRVQVLDCVTRPADGSGVMNRVQIKITQNQIDVYATDAGTITPFKHIAVITNANLTLSRGLIWLEDVHYNADKGGTPSQRQHTFIWDNVGFNGPILARDLAFDVLDSLTPLPCGGTGSGCYNLGWLVPTGTPTDASTPLSLTTMAGMTTTNIAQASGPILTFNYNSGNPVTIYYKVNNGAWQSQPYPFPPCFTQNGIQECANKTIHAPVNASDLQAGTNTVQFKSSGQTSMSNVDIILPAAGGIVNP